MTDMEGAAELEHEYDVFDAEADTYELFEAAMIAGEELELQEDREPETRNPRYTYPELSTTAQQNASRTYMVQLNLDPTTKDICEPVKAEIAK
ncbi:hypothetical protein HDV05_005498 [Chytridiales sp. JEL 0842]|nr:hypothetical protein HDV05_005498 [Chytridiales sp. JEL 0842]